MFGSVLVQGHAQQFQASGSLLSTVEPWSEVPLSTPINATTGFQRLKVLQAGIQGPAYIFIAGLGFMLFMSAIGSAIGSVKEPITLHAAGYFGHIICIATSANTRVCYAAD